MMACHIVGLAVAGSCAEKRKRSVWPSHVAHPLLACWSPVASIGSHQSTMTTDATATTRRQKRSAVDFWNSYHKKSDASGVPKEWIARDTSYLLDLIAGLVVDDEEQEGGCHSARRTLAIRIIEIGCGTSTLSRSLLSHLRRRRGQLAASSTSSPVSYHIVATDVSEVCIQNNRDRDGAFIGSLADDAVDTLRYETLDALSTSCTGDAKLFSKGSLYDIVLDKGCLDTFLFRNSRGNKSTDRHPPLLAALLFNVSKMLQQGGKYIVISPRRRIPSLAQFVGFKNDITKLEVEARSVGDLEGNQGDNPSAKAYVFVCKRARDIDIGDRLDPPSENSSMFRDTSELSLISDESICEGCGLTFAIFRGDEPLTGRGEMRWFRKWKGHKQHCNKNL